MNGRATLLMKEVLIPLLNTLLAIIWLLRDASDIALDCLSTPPAENFFGLLRRIIHDANMFSQMLQATVNLRLMNERIEILSKEGDPDVRRIPTRMNMAGLKIRKAQIDQHVVIARTLTGTTDWNSMSFLVISSNWLCPSGRAIRRTKRIAPSLRPPSRE
jgi:hypothetical protein